MHSVAARNPDNVPLGQRKSLLRGRHHIWRLCDFIAEGGTARVYRAKDDKYGLIGAAKILKSCFVDNRQLLDLFVREATILATVDSLHVPRLLDHDDSLPRPYTVVELLPGLPLSAYTAWRRPLPVAWTIGMLIDVTRGLRAIHATRWVHGDIKPANVIVGRHRTRERAHVIDFGVAAAFGEKTEQLAGTPHFYAPENVRGENRSSANDMYSLGVLAFQCLTGRMPFDGQSVPDILRHHVESPVPSPRSINPQLPEEMEAIIRRLLDKRSEHRGDTTQLLTELERLYATLPTNIIPLPKPASDTGELASLGRTHTSPRCDIPTTIPSAARHALLQPPRAS